MNKKTDDDIHDFIDYPNEIENAHKMAQITDWFEEVIHQVYRIGNTDLLDSALEELSFLLDVDIPDTKMVIQKLPDPLFEQMIKLSNGETNE